MCTVVLKDQYAWGNQAAKRRVTFHYQGKLSLDKNGKTTADVHTCFDCAAVVLNDTGMEEHAEWHNNTPGSHYVIWTEHEGHGPFSESD